jgi:hypothetical protein
MVAERGLPIYRTHGSYRLSGRLIQSRHLALNISVQGGRVLTILSDIDFASEAPIVAVRHSNLETNAMTG